MPDGDIVHPQLGAMYQKLYMQLCEGVLSEDALAYEAVQRIKRQAQAYGSGPIELLCQVAAQFESLAADQLRGVEIDWGQERRTIKELEQQVAARSSKRATGLALKACEGQLQELRSGPQRLASSSQVLPELVQAYLLNIYDANFVGRIPLPQHYNGVDAGFVQERLLDMRPSVIKWLESLAVQIAEGKAVEALRMPRRTKRSQILDPETDLAEIMRQ